MNHHQLAISSFLWSLHFVWQVPCIWEIGWRMRLTFRVPKKNQVSGELTEGKCPPKWKKKTWHLPSGFCPPASNGTHFHFPFLISIKKAENRVLDKKLFFLGQTKPNGRRDLPSLNDKCHMLFLHFLGTVRNPFALLHKSKIRDLRWIQNQEDCDILWHQMFSDC